MPSFDMESLDSFDIVSFFMLSLDIVSFFMASSLPILSWAKAAGAIARPSERAAAEVQSGIRLQMVMVHLPFEIVCASDECRQPARRIASGACYGVVRIFPDT